MHEQNPKNLPIKKPAKRKSILYYTPFFAWADWRIGYGQEPFSRLKCPVDNCVITNDSNLNTGSVSDFDAVLFHMRDVKANDLPDQTKRRREQVYVMVLKESPVHDFTNYDHFKGIAHRHMSHLHLWLESRRH